MRDQYQKNQDVVREHRRISAVEKLAIEAEMKEWKTKRVHVLNETNILEVELTKTVKEIQAMEEQLRLVNQDIPTLEQSKFEVNDKKALLESELKKMSGVAELREKNCAALRVSIKQKQDQAAKAKQEEEMKLAEIKLKLQNVRSQLEEANIGLFPEISKYRGLVDVVEVKLTPQSRKKRRTTIE